MTHRLLSLFPLAALAVLFTAAPAAAADPGPSALIAGGYWSGFVDHWHGVFQKQNGIVMGTLVVGALCLFIITRGKWRK
jgi:hypothetical protein